jgi:hypothetical protein
MDFEIYEEFAQIQSLIDTKGWLCVCVCVCV